MLHSEAQRHLSAFKQAGSHTRPATGFQRCRSICRASAAQKEQLQQGVEVSRVSNSSGSRKAFSQVRYRTPAHLMTAHYIEPFNVDGSCDLSARKLLSRSMLAWYD
eukprot:GHUV01035622.1.p2 GENE.GHUV01035622.1~~GHUV01035622.1.p2  ORF type:complete len:106 (+),score=4.83 GHUV01035622.1:277-594(+)